MDRQQTLGRLDVFVEEKSYTLRCARDSKPNNNVSMFYNSNCRHGYDSNGRDRCNSRMRFRLMCQPTKMILTCVRPRVSL